MAHTLSGIRTERKSSNTPLEGVDAAQGGDWAAHIDGETQIVRMHGETSTVVVTTRGWDAVDSFLERFSPDGIPIDAASYAAAVSRWETAPASVVYALGDNSDALIGLSYQTTHEEVLRAVWTGFCTALARKILTVATAGHVRVVSEHPGTAELVHRLSELGVSADSAPTPGATRHLEADRLSDRVTATGQKRMIR